MPSPTSEMPPAKRPRSLAVDILNRVDVDGAFAEPLLDRYLAGNVLPDERDRRLLTELVYGTLRMQGALDWVIGQFYQGDIRTLEPMVRNILRMALYQRFFTERIPDFAIVHEAVEQVKRTISPRRASLVNAVLRNVLRRHDALPRPEGRENTPEHIAVLHSHPLWLVRKWVRLFGPQEAAALCQANNRIPPLSVRVNRLRAGRQAVIRKLSEEGFPARETLFSPDGLIIDRTGQSLRDSVCYRTGLVQIQDEASQIISCLVAPVAGERVLDLCAGVGGKATHLAEIMGNRGVIVAVDIQDKKLSALQELAVRLGTRMVTTRAADAMEDLGAEFHESFDRVLVDAPCSGVGTLRRAPEIKWRLTPKDLRRCVLLQKQLLGRAAPYVRPGGRLVYSTCSILEEENEAVVAEFLASRRAFSLMRPPGLDEALTDQQGHFRTYPHRHGMDGFFAAVMVRRKESRIREKTG